ncbi:MAG: DUF4190 domain-containing protein, partial [Candidatus Woesearchaeota archaeon]
GIAGMICGILSLFLLLAPYLGIILAITAVVFYAIQHKKKPTGAATAGLVTGVLGIILNGFMLLLLIGTMALFSGLADVGTTDNVIIQPTDDVVTETTAEVKITPKNEIKKIEEKPKTLEKKKVKSATLSIDNVQIQLANLYPIRLTIINTGDVDISPKFDVIVLDGKTEICHASPMIPFDTIKAGSKKTDEIQIMGCMFDHNGDYNLIVDFMDSEFNKLDSKTYNLKVNDQILKQQEDMKDLLNQLG